MTCIYRYFGVSGDARTTPSLLGIRDTWLPLVVVDSFLLSDSNLVMDDMSSILTDSPLGCILKNQEVFKLNSLK